MNKFIKPYLLILAIGFIAFSCNDFSENEIYQRPEWLKGKLYTQVKSIPELSLFAECLERSGLSEMVDKSGYYTVFAPTNDAVLAYLESHPEYGGEVAGIPENVLNRIVRIHILQNGWTLHQLRSLDYQGWIDEKNELYDEPRGYKRQSILIDSVVKRLVYYYEGENEIVLNESEANGYKKTIPDSRKYVPIYYEDLFRVTTFSEEDYTYFFNRPYEEGVYFAGGKIVTEQITGSSQIPAENGFIHIIDDVIEELPNMEQVLLASIEEEPDHNYSDFLSMIYKYSRFSFNAEATNKQEGVTEGLLVDSLFRLTFPGLTFNISDEETGRRSAGTDYSLRENNTIIAPNNAALGQFFNTITVASGKPYWTDRSVIPEEIMQSIINSLLSEESAYRTELDRGIINGTGDLITVDQSVIVEKKYCSNGMFYGINEMIIPRVFESVVAPVYLRPKFNSMFYAIEHANLLKALKRADREYTLFIPSDDIFKTDSSLLLEWQNRELNQYYFEAFILSDQSKYRLNSTRVKNLLLHQVALGVPQYSANVEFLETMAGSHICMDHTTGIVKGTAPSTFGYLGDDPIDLVYIELEDAIDNGRTFEVNGLFSMTSNNAFSVLSRYPKFFDLLDQVGLVSKSALTANVVSKLEKYTIFVPTDSALSQIDTDTMSVADIKKLLLSHFITGAHIFTDNKMAEGNYKTLCIDEENSTEFATKYKQVYIETRPDGIAVKRGGELLVDFSEDETKNIVIAFDKYPTIDSEFDYVTNAVVHEIDTLFTLD
jgi:uncharacterized surface protein with fasciclin (FAS1) repeats